MGIIPSAHLKDESVSKTAWVINVSELFGVGLAIPSFSLGFCNRDLYNKWFEREYLQYKVCMGDKSCYPMFSCSESLSS